MKKIIIALSLVGVLGAVSPAFAAELSARQQSRLQMAADYGRAIEVMHIDGRYFLVQAEPKTVLEIKSKLFWLNTQLLALQRAELLNTY